MMKFLVFLVAIFLGSGSTTPDSNPFIPILTPHKDSLRRSLMNPRNYSAEDLPTIDENWLECGLCTAMVPALRFFAPLYERSQLLKLLISACEDLNVAPRPYICRPIVESYADQFLYLFLESDRPAIDMCGVLNRCGSVSPDYTDWSFPLDSNKPALTSRGDVPDETELVKIIQFTDIHIDLAYKEGTTNDCGEEMVLCCREEFGPPPNPTKSAGKYGDWKCALPMEAFEEMLKHAKLQDAKYLFLTGDYMHSAGWNYSEYQNSMHILNMTQKVVEVFQNTDVKIYFVTGNHDAHVVNLYAPIELWENNTGFSLNWMYENTSSEFLARDPNLLEPAEQENFHIKGYYSVSPERGLRILAINTNLCYMSNFWLAINTNDPNGQLAWLAEELLKAEKATEVVYIIGHIEPGSCWPVWSDKFAKIVNRFEGIIRGQFYGHSHRPQFRISFDKGTSLRPTGVSLVAGSALTDYMNPAYTVYHVDGARDGASTWDVVNMEMVVLDLLQSNEQNTPVIRTLMDTAGDLGLKDLRPESVAALADKLRCDQAVMDKYLEFHSKGPSPVYHPVCNITEKDCVVQVVCAMFGSNSGDTGPCDKMKRIIAKGCDSQENSGSGIMYNISGVLLVAIIEAFRNSIINTS